VTPVSTLWRTILCLSVVLLAVPGAVRAEGKLEAHYRASLAGLPIGKGSWVVDIGDTHYTAAASGATTGLIKVFVGGSGTGAAQGTLAGGKPAAANYSATLKAGKHKDEVRMTVAGGNVKEFKLEPPQDPDPKRIPVTEAQRHGVLDPMTASLAIVSGTGEVSSPKVCERSVAVFDGKMRYDLKLGYKRTEKVKAEKGYSGLAYVCSVTFVPVAGYIPSRSAIKYLARSEDIEVWLVPIAGTRVMVPFRAQIETPFGLGVVEATRFVATAGSSQAKAGKTN
jgi:hypothetical protein